MQPIVARTAIRRVIRLLIFGIVVVGMSISGFILCLIGFVSKSKRNETIEPDFRYLIFNHLGNTIAEADLGCVSPDVASARFMIAAKCARGLGATRGVLYRDGDIAYGIRI